MCDNEGKCARQTLSDYYPTEGVTKVATTLPSPSFESYLEMLQFRYRRSPIGSRRGIALSFLHMSSEHKRFHPPNLCWALDFTFFGVTMLLFESMTVRTTSRQDLHRCPQGEHEGDYPPQPLGYYYLFLKRF